MNLEDLIRKYLEYGFSLIPLKWKEKRPDPSVLPKVNGKPSWKPLQERKPTEEELKLWFFSGLPRNVGIVLGEISGNLFVIDLDSQDLVKEFMSHGGESVLKSTLSVRTSRGIHIYLKWTGKPIRPMKFETELGEIDIKGKGGYITAPPSLHPSGARYEIINLTPPKEAKNPEYEKTEDWLPLFFEHFFPNLRTKDGKLLHEAVKEKLKGMPSSSSSSSPTPRAIENVNTIDAIKEKIPPCLASVLNGVHEGMRNETAFLLASYLADIYGVEIAWILLKEWNQRNKPPLPESELKNVLNSAKKYNISCRAIKNRLSIPDEICKKCHHKAWMSPAEYISQIKPEPVEMKYDDTPDDLKEYVEFPKLRPGQLDAMRQLLSSNSSIIVLKAPTGWGKTVVFLAYGRKHGGFIVIEPNRGLQDQIEEKYSVPCIKGKRNYECVCHKLTCDIAPCSVVPHFKCPYQVMIDIATEDYSDVDSEDDMIELLNDPYYINKVTEHWKEISKNPLDAFRLFLKSDDFEEYCRSVLSEKLSEMKNEKEEEKKEIMGHLLKRIREGDVSEFLEKMKDNKILEELVREILMDYFIEKAREEAGIPCEYMAKVLLARILLRGGGGIVLNNGNFWFFLGNANVVIIDEFHKVIKELCEEIVLDESIKAVNKYDALGTEDTLITARLKELEERIKSLPIGSAEYVDVAHEIVRLRNKKRRVKFFMDNIEHAILYRKNKKLRIRLIEDATLKRLVRLLSTNKKVLLVSATPIPLDDIKHEIVDVRANFINKKNAPIIYYPVEKNTVHALMRRNYSLHLTAEAIKFWYGYFLHNGYTKKAIVHCGNIGTHGRILAKLLEPYKCVLHLKGKIDESVKRFKKEDDKQFLVIAGGEDGYDFYGKDYTLQFIAKVPYPALDEFWQGIMKEKGKEEFERLFNQEAVSRIIQISGRICRGGDDIGVTVILDSKFEDLFRQYYDMFDDDFRKRLIDLSPDHVLEQIIKEHEEGDKN